MNQYLVTIKYYTYANTVREVDEVAREVVRKAGIPPHGHSLEVEMTEYDMDFAVRGKEEGD